MSDAPSAAGFSLIELMVALVIVAILSAFTLPAYRDHVLRTNVPEATSGLLLTAMRMEQFYQDHRSYRDDAGCGVTLPASTLFAFRCESPTDGQSFLLTATGVASGAMQEFIFTLDQQGNARTTALPAAWGTVPVDCWITRRGAIC